MKVTKRNEWGYLKYQWKGMPLNAKTGGKIGLTNGEVYDYASIPHEEKIWDNSPIPYRVTSQKLVIRIPFQSEFIDVPIEDADADWVEPTP